MVVLTDLPEKVRDVIAQSLPREELPVLAQTCQVWHDTATKELYAVLDLDDTYTGWKCMESLCIPEPHEYCPNVRSLTLSFDISSVKEDQVWWFRDMLGRSLQKMTGLKEFVCETAGLIGTSSLTTLTELHANTLESLTLTLQATDFDIMISIHRLKVLPEFKALKDVKFMDHSEEPHHDNLVKWGRHLLDSNRGVVSKLRFASAKNATAFMGEGEDAGEWPALLTLSGPPDVVELPVWAHAPALHRLGIFGRESKPIEPLKINENYFPALDTVWCPANALPSLLPDSAKPGRPITDLYVGDIDLPGLPQAFNSQSIPTWEESVEMLKYLPNSSGPATTLDIHLEKLIPEKLPLAIPYLQSVQDLTVTLYEDIESIEAFGPLGKTFFSQLPNMHKFHLCCADMERENEGTGEPTGFKHAEKVKTQKRILDNWSRSCKTLTEVQLTCAVQWYKTDEGWTTDVEIPEEEEDSSEEEEPEAQRVNKRRKM